MRFHTDVNTKDEIIDAIEGRYRGELPPPAILTQTGTVEQMEACGVHWPEAHYDADKMVRLALQPADLFGFATARVPFDITEEAEALGCEIFQGKKDSQPMVSGSPWRDLGYVPEVPDLISPSEMMESPRIRTVLDASERIHDVRQDLFLTANCISPAGIVSHLVGMESLVMGTMMDPDNVRRWVEKLVPYCMAYAGALSEVADNVCVITSQQADLLPPETNNAIGAIEKDVLSSVRLSYRMIHNCGNTLPLVENLVAMKPDILSLEYSPSPEAYLKSVCGRCRTIGCINPVGVLLQSTPERVRFQSLESARLGFDLVGPECGVPPRTPNANMSALARYREPA